MAIKYFFKDLLHNEILEFYGQNHGTAEMVVVWDICKPFLRSKLIALQAFRDREKCLVRVKITSEIRRLGQEINQKLLKDKMEQLWVAYDELKFLDAHKIVQDVLYGKQKFGFIRASK